MRHVVLSLVLVAVASAQIPCLAQIYSNGMTPRQYSGPQSVNPSGFGPNPYFNPYTNPYGVNPYANPYGVNPYGGYPAMGMPVPINGGNFGINIGNARLNVWKAPSGYYYPWLPRPAGFGYAAPTIIINQGAQNPTPALPPLTTIFGDMNKFLDDAKAKGKITDADYNHLKLRASDLQKKERSLATGNGGTLEQNAEEQLRKDVDKLGEEVAYRVKS